VNHSSLFSLKPYALIFMCALLAACQKPEPVSFQEPAQIEASSTQTLDLTDLCQKIDKNMSEIDAQRTTFALEQINQDLKLCLPLLGFQQLKHLLGLSNKMYHDFLSVERTPQQQRAFESYALEMAQHPTIQQSLFEQLTIRDQYLIKHQGGMEFLMCSIVNEFVERAMTLFNIYFIMNKLVRGKTGRVYGDLMSLLTLMKGQPLAYNKDNQEDKEPLFDAIDTVRGSLMAFADMIPALVPNIEIMREAALRGFSTATDLADYLVKNGVAFRDAHEIVGKAVALGVQESKDLSELTLEQLQQFSDLIQADVFEKALTLEASVNARNHIGGTAPAQVEAAIERAHARLEKLYAQ
jgi:HPt (histidine-containing phosphotransfer) domain-containing protein